MNKLFRSKNVREMMTRAAAAIWLVPSSLLLLQAASANDASKSALQPTAGVGKTTANNSVVPPIPSPDTAVQGATFELQAKKPETLGGETKAAIAPAALPANALTNVTESSNTASGTTSPPANAATTNMPAAGTNPAATNTAQAGAVQPDMPQTNQSDTAKASEANTPSSANAGSMVPNGAALQTQLLPIGKTESFPWTTLLAGTFLILGIAATGVMAVRIKQGRGFSTGRSEKQLQLITSMALSPKRQIILVRIRDKEVALASTEHGITMLTELSAQNKGNLTFVDDGGGEEPRKKKVTQRTNQDEPVKLVASSAGDSQSAGEETALARSEMLMGALKNLREKNLRNKPNRDDERNTAPVATAASSARTADARSTERKMVENQPADEGKRESTMKQTRAAFPKYLANAFEQESKRTLPQSQSQQPSNQDEAGNVTNMIRERLKELRPLS